MIYHELTQWRALPGFAQHEIWRTAFAWLENSARGAAEGLHPLGHEGFFARVMSYALKSRAEARYEMHRHTIDLQFTLEGGEGIEVTPAAGLKPLNDYDAAKDVEFFVTPARGMACVDNLPGQFTILFQGEPHQPQLKLPGIEAVRKVVVKIPARLLG